MVTRIESDEPYFTCGGVAKNCLVYNEMRGVYEEQSMP